MFINRKKLIKKIKELKKQKKYRGMIDAEKNDYFKGLNRGFEDGNDNAYNHLISLLESKKI